jgi:hypothetical protein
MILSYEAYEGEHACNGASNLGAFIVAMPHVPAGLPSRIGVPVCSPAGCTVPTLQAQLQTAQDACRLHGHPGNDASATDGMPQLYLRLVNQQY